jgi:small subunit ribosomal protein S3
LGISQDWRSHWYAESKYKDQVLQDRKIRELIQKEVGSAGVERVEIERSIARLFVTIYVSRPGIVIGRGGQAVEALKKNLSRLTGFKVELNVEEVRRPELSAKIVAENIARQVEKGLPVRRVVVQTADRVMESGALGVKIIAAGRVGGAKIARSEKVSRGSVPLQTLRADVDFARMTAFTTAGTVGVKVWIYKGEKEV